MVSLPASSRRSFAIGYSVADILDSAKFNGLSGSREKDADREPASTAAAVDHLFFSIRRNSYS